MSNTTKVTATEKRPSEDLKAVKTASTEDTDERPVSHDPEFVSAVVAEKKDSDSSLSNKTSTPSEEEVVDDDDDDKSSTATLSDATKNKDATTARKKEKAEDDPAPANPQNPVDYLSQKVPRALANRMYTTATADLTELYVIVQNFGTLDANHFGRQLTKTTKFKNDHMPSCDHAHQCLATIVDLSLFETQILPVNHSSGANTSPKMISVTADVDLTLRKEARSTILSQVMFNGNAKLMHRASMLSTITGIKARINENHDDDNNKSTVIMMYVSKAPHADTISQIISICEQRKSVRLVILPYYAVEQQDLDSCEKFSTEVCETAEDKHLTLTCDVLKDDCYTVAESVYNYNRWLNYTEILHALRELGFWGEKTFPNLHELSEHAFSKTEIHDFCVKFFGQKAISVQAPANWDAATWDRFVDQVAEALKAEKEQTSLILKKSIPWIDIDCLRQMMQEEGSSWRNCWKKCL